MALGLQYWFVPIVSASIWTAMLITMLVYWAATGRPHYISMNDGQTIPYISDIGADVLKPLFITMSAVTVVTFDLVFIMERWLRHAGRLTPNTSTWQKVNSICAIIAAIAGAAGLILLSIFDTKRHNKLHNIFLAVFIGGYIVSAIFICWAYQRLGIHYRQHSVLRISFWMKLFFILAEIALAVAFGTTSKTSHWNVAAVLEWTIAFLYGFYVISFAVDFLPALHTKGQYGPETQMQVAEEGGRATMGDGAAESQQYFRHNATSAAPHRIGQANGYSNGHTNGHAHGHSNGYSNGYTDGHEHQKPEVSSPPSSNF